jgi:hypothetical protein
MKSPAAAAPHFLDTLPFDVSRPGARELLGILAALYWKGDRATPRIHDSRRAWAERMTAPRTRNRLRTVIDHVLADPAAEAWHGRIRELIDDDAPTTANVPVADTDSPSH